MTTVSSSDSPSASTPADVLLAYCPSRGGKYHRIRPNRATGCGQAVVRDDWCSVPASDLRTGEECRICWAYYSDIPRGDA